MAGQGTSEILVELHVKEPERPDRRPSAATSKHEPNAHFPVQASPAEARHSRCRQTPRIGRATQPPARRYTSDVLWDSLHLVDRLRLIIPRKKVADIVQAGCRERRPRAGAMTNAQRRPPRCSPVSREARMRARAVEDSALSHAVHGPGPLAFGNQCGTCSCFRTKFFGAATFVANV